MRYQSKWGTVENLELHINSYADNQSLFMELINMDGEYPEPYGNITVNLGGDIPDYCAFVDTNNMPEMEQFIRYIYRIGKTKWFLYLSAVLVQSG